jgi:hypothetical protein|uniref:Uncharacterized protein n=1 Tax=Picea glauca TaxID=3330 RepID=A0A124GML9_PICGL|nr:hypothetical protein ABT39_MTgene1894 [Picea glauca]QHR92535.1 hypothetical protein Q903MT_gene6581 [Picea sitchensis]
MRILCNYTSFEQKLSLDVLGTVGILTLKREDSAGTRLISTLTGKGPTNTLGKDPTNTLYIISTITILIATSICIMSTIGMITYITIYRAY